MMDRAVWATWYDLPDRAGAEFLGWLHGTYIPELLDRPGFLWAAHYRNDGGGAGVEALRRSMSSAASGHVGGGGSQYLLLVGAADARTLLAPDAVEREAAHTGPARRMLDLRTGVRACLFQEYARVDGPEVAHRPQGTTPAPVVQVGSYRAKSVADEHVVSSWYVQHRLPIMSRMPGCIGARSLVGIAGWPRFGVIYEFVSLAARHEHFELPLESEVKDSTDWTARVRAGTIHAPGTPVVGRRLWPSVPEGH